MPLPRNYLPVTIPDNYRTALTSFLQTVQRYGRHLIVYIVPHATEAFPHYGFDVARFQAVNAELTSLCVQSGSLCITDMSQFRQEDFIDIVHLSPRGHQRVAEMLIGRMN